MRNKIRNTLGLALGALLTLGSAQAEVVVSSRDGTVSITGELLGFENGQYIVQSVLGPISLPASTSICEGAECPQNLIEMGETIRLAGSPVLVGRYLFNVLDEYALELDASLVKETSASGQENFILSNDEGEMIVTLEVTPLEPVSAFDALLNGQADMILSSRRAGRSEVDAFLDRGFDDLTSPATETIIAQDGLVVVTSPDNPVKALTIAELEAVFSGSVTNWSQLGGPDLPIEVHLPGESSGEVETFYTAVLEPNFAELSSELSYLENIRDVDSQVARSVGAVGLTSSSLVGNARPLEVISACGLVARAEDFSIKSEDYTLTRRMYAYTAPNKQTGHMVKLVELMQFQPEAAGNAGLVSLATTSSDLNNAGKRIGHALTDPAQSIEIGNLQRFVREVLNAERLSTTFRFGLGSSQLDNKARADAVRLAELLKQPQYAGSEVLLVGFTDSIGRSEVNVLLSQRRAQQVLDEILLANVDLSTDQRVSILGFGASAPVACNTEDSGRELNRRVEVWIR